MPLSSATCSDQSYSRRREVLSPRHHLFPGLDPTTVVVRDSNRLLVHGWMAVFSHLLARFKYPPSSVVVSSQGEVGCWTLGEYEGSKGLTTIMIHHTNKIMIAKWLEEYPLRRCSSRRTGVMEVEYACLEWDWAGMRNQHPRQSFLVVSTCHQHRMRDGQPEL